MTRCSRCGDPIEYRRGETHCPRCIVEVAVLVRADAKRRVSRWRPKDLTGALV
jgi:uncharacterized Zn finger protein (UPF0148 family)